MVDTHCHLDACEPADAELVARADAVGVRRIATVGTDAASVERALAAARAYEQVFAIAGHHPNESTGFGERDRKAIEQAAIDPAVRAIGETGLDFYRDYAPPDDQQRAFEAQIDIARAHRLPLVVHTRAAEEQTFATLRDRADGLTVILHCFGAPARLDECVERGYLCSFAGNVTYPKARELQRAALRVPADMLLVETDAPYLAPQKVRGKPNEPANVARTAAFLAELRGIAYDELDAIVERNAARVFGW